MSETTLKLEEARLEVQRLEREVIRLSMSSDGKRSLYIYADGRIENKPRTAHTGSIFYVAELEIVDPSRWAPLSLPVVKRRFRVLDEVGDLLVYGEIR